MTIPEETPVNELIDTAFAIEDRAGVALGPVVVNGCYEPPAFSLAQATPEAIAADAVAVDRFVSPREADDLARRGRVPRRALRDAAGTGRRGSPSGSRCRRSACRSSSAPRSAEPRSTTSPTCSRRASSSCRRRRDRVDAPVAATRDRSRRARRARRAGHDRDLLRQRWRRQDDDGRGDRAGGRAPRARRGGRDDRPGEATRQRARARRALRHAERGAARAVGSRRHVAPASGRLSALMLDTKTTFDRLVTRYAVGEEQAERILDNGFYRNVSGALSGTQEYMAMEKLYELHEDGGYELIVVDTPPTRHALDFLDAPDRLLRMLDNRIFRLLMMPTRAYLRVASVAVQTFLRTVSRVVGTEVVDDIVAFFRAFEGMEAGFRERAQRCARCSPTAAPRSCSSPRRDATRSTKRSSSPQRLEGDGRSVAALIVNRVHPSFGTELSEGLRLRAERAPRVDARREPAQRPARGWPRSTTTSPTSTRSRRASGPSRRT